MSSKFPRGSEWRKWDLHVHTPASGMANKYGDAWDRYVKELFTLAIERQVAVLGITDYFTIEGYEKIKTDYLYNDAKLLELFETQEMVRKVRSILLLPNVEFRLETLVNNRRVNYHVIFSDEVSIQDIKENFLGEIEFVRESMPFEGDDVSKISRHNIEDLGRKIKAEQPSFDGNDFSIGCKVAAVQASQIKKVLDRHKNIFADKYLIGIPVDEDLSSISWKSQEHNVRKTLYQQCAFFFSSNENTREFGLGKKHPSNQAYLEEFKTYKPCVIGSDAHSFDQLEKKLGIHSCSDQSKITWIKADPTFYGLKQIVFEPEERVRIQEKSPELDIDKSPFTAVTITSPTQIFADNQDVKFAPGTLSLNNGLVSIIGGRGTGKSALIGYLASGFGVDDKVGLFTEKAASFIVARKTSLSEEAKQFSFDTSPQVPFVYISQSEVKEVLRNPDGFTQNIRKTIGIVDDYSIPIPVVTLVDDVVNEFYRIVKSFNSDGTSVEEKKVKLQNDILRYKQFIANVTSETNKHALEQYAGMVRQKHLVEVFAHEVETLAKDIEERVTSLNDKIDELNARAKKLPPIPHIEKEQVITHIRTKWQETINAKSRQIDAQIQGVKDRFPEYTGDLASLLQNISQYQSYLMDCEKRLAIIKNDEERLVEIKNKGFVTVGTAIKQSLLDYKERIENKWKEFKAGSPELTEERRTIIADIFNDGAISVRVDIAFDEEKMHQLLLEKLDGRRYSRQKLKDRLQINTSEDFLNFITQVSPVNLFSSDIDDELRGRILSVFFRRFTEFIHHRIIIESNGRPITKLSHGQQGTIYLKLKIAANMFSETLVYDQPEDDLDNQFITEELVKLFRRIKKHRQVIIVSHNANLVVNADSEQVIVAHNDDGVLSYTSGALEDPEINRAVCQILEGGKQAFENRERKYNLSDGD